MSRTPIAAIMSAEPARDYQAVVSAPGFALGICCTEDDIVDIDFLAARTGQEGRNPLAREAARQLHAYLQDAGFQFSLPLAPAGTPFQRRVWAQISAIPPGQTRSYGELAMAVKSAARAVGGACGANPYPVVVPCHRVIAREGGLGGFSRQRGGLLLDIKRWLLRHEGVL